MSEELSNPPNGDKPTGEKNKHKKEKALFIAIAILIVIGLFFYLTFFFNKKPVSEPGAVVKEPVVKEISGDLTIAAGETKTIENGDTLKVSGNLTVDGELNCLNGGLWVEVAGDASINGKVACTRSEEMPEKEAAAGIALVVNGALNINEGAKLETNGHVQFVDDASLLAATREEFLELYVEAAEDTGEGIRVGPFITKDMAAASAEEEESSEDEVSFIKTANAAGKDWTITGELEVKKPPRWKKQITIVRFLNLRTLTIRDFDLMGPDGNDGSEDMGKKCTARGRDGQDALRFLVNVPNLRINNFNLWLGYGGSGGGAFTLKDCYPGLAYGGDGGKAGNFKLIGRSGINIVGSFIIHPGRSGDGGSATAWGGDGEPGKPGGDATAEGGSAENNEKAIRAQGAVNGTNFIEIDSMEGGGGGGAAAFAGRGGDGPACKSMDGGAGGNARAVPGDGGDAVIVLAGRGAGRTAGAIDIGGDAGSVETRGGHGGNGSQCSPTKAGGNGGKGGDGTFGVGHAGVGGTTNGNPTKVIEDIAGDGGNGGDGCLPGKGANGGGGLNPGMPGIDGKNLCPPEEKKEEPVGKVGDDVKPEEPKEEPKGVLVNLAPGAITFEHVIGETACPTPAGTIAITNAGEGAADGWQVSGTPPMWLNLPTSGTLPGSLPVEFSCMLDQYITQELNTSINIQLTNAGIPVGDPGSFNITGYVAGE